MTKKFKKIFQIEFDNEAALARAIQAVQRNPNEMELQGPDFHVLVSKYEKIEGQINQILPSKA